MLRYTGSPASSYANPAAFEPCHVDNLKPAALSGPSFLIPASLPDTDRPVSLPAILQQFMPLEDHEVAALVRLAGNSKPYAAGHILIHEDSPTDYVYILLEGVASRYKHLQGGERQILGFLLPGDLCDIHFINHKPDHSVALLSNAKIVKIPCRRLTEFLTSYPRIERALSMAALLEIAILRQWLLNIGQRDAFQRLSHLFCEMKCRLARVGQVESDGSFGMPINQCALADSTGLSLVHINRTLQRLRSEGLIRLRRRRLTILDPERLATLAGFKDDYLQMKPYRP